ncbi:MAG: hypothetical protein Q9162_005672 [Coniocarpon cinnabarinum]
MPKNPHPPRNGGPAKKAPVEKKGDDKKGKSKKGDTGTPVPETSKDAKAKGGVEDASLPNPQDVPKKPTTRELLAGTSWTGKLPLNLFNEHCQKAQWEKPEYTMHRLPSGFVSSVILRRKNKKTQEVTELPPMRFPKSYEHLQPRETAVEARHFAATWALFRVANMKNIHLTLPPQYKDLWLGPFREIKAEDVKEGKTWMYSADPFLAYKELEEERARSQKRREEAEKQKLKREEAQASGDLLAAAGGKDPLRGWKTAPRVEIGKRLRRDVEILVRREGAWNPNGIVMSSKMKAEVVADLISRGFRPSHCEEAVSICKDGEETLEWLLIHVPEDDLPKWALPENYVAGVSKAGDPRREAAIGRLSAGGYTRELCEDMYDACRSNEHDSAVMLQQSLLGDSTDAENVEDLSPLSLKSQSCSPSEWLEEQDALQSIYGQRYSQSSDVSCTIQLETDDSCSTLWANFLLGEKTYPESLPVLRIIGELPSYIKLDMTHQVLVYAKAEFLGQSMIFNIVDWLEQNANRVIDNPGSLRAVANSTTPGFAEHDRFERTSQRQKRQHPEPIRRSPGDSVSQSMLRAWQQRQQTPPQQKMLAARQSLPAWLKRDAIVEAVQTHQITIISGATGSGKSTQSVQFVLDDMIQRQLGSATKIICTQPRRISALGLADRVAEERCDVVGNEVGYAIRGQSRQSRDTRILFCTTGVLLRRLQTSGGQAEDVVKCLADVSHVVVDEVHERSLDTDFLLALLRDVIERRKDLKIVLMSATLDAAAFLHYFGGPANVAQIEVEGRTFPVDDYYLDDVVRMTSFRDDRVLQDEYMETDRAATLSKAVQSVGIGINYSLISALANHIDAELGVLSGAILIFLPGTMEIKKTLDVFQGNSRFHALPLHAGLLPAEQRRVFPPATRGKRKVIAATNVAETSITIPDVVAIIDSGRVKETQYDPQSSMVKLAEVWASKAASQQRRGRAGRVSAGKAYKLFTRQAEASRMPDKPEPEIRRTPLEQLCLSVKAMGKDDVVDFLSKTITPPEIVAIEGALILLKRMGATDHESLTALGELMAMIPADLRCAKLMILGALFGCLEASITIAAILTVGSPFVSPQEKRDEAKQARESFGRGQNIGDLLTDLRAFDEWSKVNVAGSPQRKLRAWCDSKFLSNQRFSDIESTRQQYFASLQEAGIPSVASGSVSKDSNTNSSSISMLNALVLASLSPQTLRILYPPTKYTATSSGNLPLDPSAKSIQFFDESNGRVFIHPSSTLFSAQGYPGNPGFMSFWNKVATSKVFARELSPAGTFAVLLFAGSGMEVDKLGRGVVVDGWMRVRGWARIGVLVNRLRSVIDAKLRTWFEHPDDIDQASQKDIVSLVKRLVELEGLDQ